MKLKKLFLFVKTILVCSFFSNAIQATHVELELFPERGKQTVTLPFPYHHLKPDERSNVKFIPEKFYTVLEDSLKTKAIVGPLQPCIFVALRNEENGKTVVFHKHFSNSLDHLIKIAKKELNLQEANNLKGCLFTNNMLNYNQPVLQGVTTQSLHKGKTQLQELKFIKNQLINAFNIENRTQISATKFNSPLSDWQLGDYELAECSVYVDSYLNLSSICIMHENLVGDFTKYPLVQRTNLVINKIREINQELFKERFAGKVTARSLNSYNTVHFERI